MKISKWMLAALVAAGMAHANAQTLEPGTPPAAATTAAPGNIAAPPAACCRIAAGTVVELEVTELINSSRQKRGDKFGLRLHAPLLLDGATVVPAGVTGVGEIVHASAARGGGAPGELLIAARSLDINGQLVPLRGLKFGVTGGDNSGMSFGVSIAAGTFAMFIRGREIEIPAGTRASAKLAQDLILMPTHISSPPTAISTKE